MVKFMKEVSVSVKEIAEFLYGHGSITNDRVLKARAQEGQEIHSYWQGLYSADDEKEVVCKTTFLTDELTLNIAGRIDGIIHKENKLFLEEIKSTHMDLDILEEDTFPSHMVQAKIYAYVYSSDNSLKSIDVVLTYVHVETRKITQFEKHYTFRQLQNFFEKTILKYIDWINTLNQHEVERQKSIEGIEFPFPEYRINQREMMAHVYRNILAKDIIYLEAPTGIGKTIASLFASLKAINQPREKMFYLTAKNDGKKIVIDTVRLLEEKGLIAKTCEISAKDSMCLLSERDCDPEVCKYANGYYKRIYKAIRDIFDNESLLTKDLILKYGRKHRVCPFEFSLDLSNYSDIVICDYNYVFDPLVHLVRYFDDSNYQPIVLCDEAHNLVSRSREMYSASVSSEAFVNIKDFTKYLKPNPTSEINQAIDIFAAISLELTEVDFIKKEEVNPSLLRTVKKILNKLDQVFADNKISFGKKELREFYFDLNRFAKISEFYNDDFVFLIENQNDNIVASIKCLNASEYLKRTIKDYCEACTFFSATLEPIFYYTSLLTNNIGDSKIFTSSFKQSNLLLLAIDDVSTRYNDREDSVDKIISAAKTLISGKKGNYIIFFPSYAYMHLVKSRLTEEIENVSFITQRQEMFASERAEMMSFFAENSETTQVFLFVMGGIFGESIDLIGDLLSGVLIVGVGLPALSPFNNILRSHYDMSFSSGFDYAYTFPGLNKVIQAVGRVIRTETDRGIAILLDDRFTTRKYLRLYPKNWNHLAVCNDIGDMKKMIEDFWSDSNEKDS